MKPKIIVRLLLALCVVPMLHGCTKAPSSADNPPTLTAEELAKHKAAAKAAQNAPPVNAPPAR